MEMLILKTQRNGKKLERVMLNVQNRDMRWTDLWSKNSFTGDNLLELVLRIWVSSVFELMFKSPRTLYIPYKPWDHIDYNPTSSPLTKDDCFAHRMRLTFNASIPTSMTFAFCRIHKKFLDNIISNLLHCRLRCRGSGFTIDSIVWSGIAVNDSNMVFVERGWNRQSDVWLCELVSFIWSQPPNAKPVRNVPFEEPVDISKLILIFSEGGAVVVTSGIFSNRNAMLVLH